MMGAGRLPIFHAMRRSGGLLLLILLFFQRPSALLAQQYDLRNFSLEEGLPSASVNGLSEDHAGFLWIATDEGVARTDGVRVTTFGRREGLPIDDVTAVFGARDGRVWIGCRNGAIAVWDAGTLSLLPVNGLPKAAVVGFTELADSTLLVATEGNGVLRISSTEQPAVPMNAGSPTRQVRMVVSDASGITLAATDSGLFRWMDKRWVVLPGVLLPARSVHALFTDDLGWLIGTANGYLELDTNLRPLPPMARSAGVLPITLPDPEVLSILRARNGDLWFGTPAGLVHLSKQGAQPQMKVIAEANGLGHDLVRHVLQDRSGAVWAGTAFGGASKFISDAFMHFTDRDGLASRIVSAMHRTPDGLLWFGTLGGGVASWDGHTVQNHGRASGLTDLHVLALGEDREGYLLVGTASSGVKRFRNGSFEAIGSDRLATARINVLKLDPEGRSWIGTGHGLYMDPGTGTPIPIAPRTIVVNGLAPAGDTIWVTTSTGLYFANTRVRPMELQPIPALPAVTMTGIARDGRGNLWIGTESHGMYRLKGSVVDSLSSESGLSSHGVEQVVLDAYEDVWLGTRRGIDHLQLDEFQERVLRIVNHGAEEGFIGIETFRNAGMLDDDSTLWFGTVRGATRFDPRRTLTEASEPLVHLTDLRLFFETPDWTPWCRSVAQGGIPRDLELPHDKNHLTFEFTGISLAHPERVRFSYILEGYDPEWTLNTSTDQVTYSNIPPGDYVFRVEAGNAKGWSTEPLDFAFSIAPPYWQTMPFRLGTGAFLLLGLGGYIRMRERRLRRDRERLEVMVATRTRELAAEKDRSERLLLNILPASTAQELMTHGSAKARRYESCSVLFSDFTGFTGYSSLMDSTELVSELDHFFKLFDQLCDRYQVEKIKTIGDAYMCAAGLPEPSEGHALNAVLMALGMMDAVDRTNADRMAKGLSPWPVRIGIHSGPVVAGVVGDKKFAYDIWGDTVNLASRMETNGEPGRINISGSTYAQVMDHVEARPRGPIKVKGKGEVQMYFVERLRPERSADPTGRIPNTSTVESIAGPDRAT